MLHTLATREQSDVAESNTFASFSCGVNTRREWRISQLATANCASPDSEESEETQLAVVSRSWTETFRVVLSACRGRVVLHIGCEYSADYCFLFFRMLTEIPQIFHKWFLKLSETVMTVGAHCCHIPNFIVYLKS